VRLLSNYLTPWLPLCDKGAYQHTGINTNGNENGNEHSAGFELFRYERLHTLFGNLLAKRSDM
jgi:hypothetical protein